MAPSVADSLAVEDCQASYNLAEAQIEDELRHLYRQRLQGGQVPSASPSPGQSQLSIVSQHSPTSTQPSVTEKLPTFTIAQKQMESERTHFGPEQHGQ
jgi:hypothetical protein